MRRIRPPYDHSKQLFNIIGINGKHFYHDFDNNSEGTTDPRSTFNAIHEPERWVVNFCNLRVNKTAIRCPNLIKYLEIQLISEENSSEPENSTKNFVYKDLNAQNWALDPSTSHWYKCPSKSFY